MIFVKNLKVKIMILPVLCTVLKIAPMFRSIPVGVIPIGVFRIGLRFHAFPRMMIAVLVEKPVK
jgi:hypothetical protein